MNIFQAVLSALRGDATNYPRVGVSYKGKDTDAVRQSVYGVCSAPPAGSNGLLFKVNGDSATKYAILDFMTGRFKNLSEGEVQIGNYLTQASIKFDKDGSVEINVPSGDLTATVSGTTEITTDSLTINAVSGSTINANIDVNGTVTATNFISSGISVDFNTHIHTGDSGGNTGSPK
jgi:phage gp45-like